jgi:hypothetical protein
MAQFFTSYNVSNKWVVGFKKSEYNGKNIIVFGDKSYDFDEMCGIKCQITTGSYYAEDIANHVGMLCLDGSVDSWKVSAEDMAMVRKIIHLVDIFDAQEAA